MSLSDTMFEDRRRSARVNSRVRVALEWQDAGGAAQREEADTRVVNWSGGLVMLTVDLPLDTRLRVTNLNSQETIDGVVVWKGKRVANGFEHGIELNKPRTDFWGLEF